MKSSIGVRLGEKLLNEDLPGFSVQHRIPVDVLRSVVLYPEEVEESLSLYQLILLADALKLRKALLAELLDQGEKGSFSVFLKDKILRNEGSIEELSMACGWDLRPLVEDRNLCKINLYSLHEISKFFNFSLRSIVEELVRGSSLGTN
ncbi:MAG: hypothetical protein AAGI48_08425 [Verrucomicrobiota bacterium]